MASVQDYYGTVERWTASSNVSTVRIGRRDRVPYYIQDPTGRSPVEIGEMIEELRQRMGLGPDD